MDFIIKLWSNINAIYTRIKSIINWLFPSFEKLPDNEAGELMRRYLAKKGWFDEISWYWCDLSFINRLIISVGIVLSSGLVGLILGGPTIISVLSAILISLTHTLLVAHEHHRRECALIFGEEALALNEILKESIKFFDSATKEVGDAAKELKTIADDLNENSAVVEKEANKVKEENVAIVQIVEELQAVTTQFISQQEEVMAGFANINAHVKKSDEIFKESLEATDNLGRAAGDFSDTVQEIQNSHQIFTHAVDKFCLFVNAKIQSKSSHFQAGLDSGSESDADDFLSYLEKENEKDERLLISIGAK